MGKNELSSSDDRQAINRQRWFIVKRLEQWLDTPMIILSAVWLYLMGVDMGWGLSRFAEHMTAAIWMIFILEFVLRFTLAPNKIRFFKSNWLTVISLLLPALRIFRIARALRLLARFRGVQLIRILGSINRGMKALGKTMQRRGLGYVALLTFIVTLAGAAGMYTFERSLPNGEGFDDFSTALWWTAMIVTTMGSEYWPKTPEGRALCLLLAIYAFSVFGYVTGAIATYFVGKDASDNRAELVGKKDIEQLKEELVLIKTALEKLSKHDAID